MESEFPDMSKKRVQNLQADDPAVKAIHGMTTPITFSWLRESFKANDSDLKDSLKYGTVIIESRAQLDQYLYTYGKMIQSQWEHVLSGINLNKSSVRIIDYGCGQGLALLLMSDILGTAFRSKVSEVILIEPSERGLVRAEAVCRNLFPTAKIVCLNKLLDDLDAGQFDTSSLKTIHIFSNILDVPGFNQAKVFNSTFKNGEHTILAVSHNRSFAGGAERITKFKEKIEKKKYASWITIKSSEITEFACGDGGKFPAIRWIADLGIDHG